MSSRHLQSGEEGIKEGGRGSEAEEKRKRNVGGVNRTPPDVIPGLRH